MKKLEAIKEARKLKKLEKLGAVSVKDFEALKQDVTLQRYGFLALAGIEIIRLAMPKKKSSLSQQDIDAIAERVVDIICAPAEAYDVQDGTYQESADEENTDAENLND